ncbi:hypothetical protein TanjilG_32389 [Lupinus angustifolius]|nr:hypothetical protein TanjilG_32389 [Lupinus angustifolius]
MKQNEDEWVEYRDVMDSVIERSGLDKSLFFDLKGNYDNFGVPVVGGSLDFFSKYSINGQLGRSESVNSITVETQERKHLFVEFDSTMSIGLRGPTNVFGHPTDQLLMDLDLELSRWDSQSAKPVTKISFGHFPLSFSAPSGSGRTLEDVFLKHSISAYLCGHLHTKFVVSVVARVYDSRYGNFDLVVEAPMIKHANETSRGELYVAPWNYKAFEDASPDRFWLQVEAIDIMGRSTLTDPFSINGHRFKLSWSWKEFLVMGCQWSALYYPLFWSALGWENKGYMTYIGWAVQTSHGKGKHECVGSPDIMVVVLPHLLFVVLPAFFATGALTAERGIYREHMLAFSGKKKDDIDLNSRRSLSNGNQSNIKSNFPFRKRWIRKHMVCLAVCWKHFMNCRTVTKAYDMNPVLHFLGYGFSIPLLLAYATMLIICF